MRLDVYIEILGHFRNVCNIGQNVLSDWRGRKAQ